MVSYDWVRFVERVPDANPDETGMPDLWFVLPETIVVVDNVRKTAAIVRHVSVGADTDLGRAYADAMAAVERVVERLREPLPAEPRSAPVRAPMDVRRSVTREAFHESVKRAKEYIEAGDIFQVVLSQQFRIPLQVDPFTIYRHLRVINPSPYLFFLRCEGPVLIGSSPRSWCGSRTARSTCVRSPARGRAAARPTRTARSRPTCSPTRRSAPST
jgi:anthranilate synthase component 1